MISRIQSNHIVASLGTPRVSLASPLPTCARGGGCCSRLCLLRLCFHRLCRRHLCLPRPCLCLDHHSSPAYGLVLHHPHLPRAVGAPQTTDGLCQGRVAAPLSQARAGGCKRGSLAAIVEARYGPTERPRLLRSVPLREAGLRSGRRPALRAAWLGRWCGCQTRRSALCMRSPASPSAACGAGAAAAAVLLHPAREAAGGSAKVGAHRKRVCCGKNAIFCSSDLKDGGKIPVSRLSSGRETGGAVRGPGRFGSRFARRTSCGFYSTSVAWYIMHDATCTHDHAPWTLELAKR